MVVKHDDHTPCEESSTITNGEQLVDSKDRRRSKRHRPVEEVIDVQKCTQENPQKPNDTSGTQPVSQSKRRKVSKEAQAKGAGEQAGHVLDSQGMKAFSDSRVNEMVSSASKRKRAKKTTPSKVAENQTNSQPYVLVDVAAIDRESYVLRDGPSMKQEAEPPRVTLARTQPDLTEMQVSGTTGEECPQAEAKDRPSAGSSQHAEAQEHGIVAKSSDVQIPDGDSAKRSQYAPIFLPRRRSPRSDIGATKPDSVTRKKIRRSGRQEAAQVDASRASSECRDLSKRGTLIVILRYRHGSRPASDGPEREQEKIITKDVTKDLVDLTVDSTKNSPRLEITKRSTKPVHPFFLGRTTKQPNLATNKAFHRLNADASLSDEKQLTSGSDTDRGVRNSSRRPDSSNKALGLGFAAGLGGAILGAGSCKSVVKFPGAVEASWPAKGMVHIRGLEAGYEHGQGTKSESLQATTVRRYQTRSQQKLKQNALQIPQHEDILHSLARRLVLNTRATPLISDGTNGQKPQPLSAVRLPERIVSTGSALKVLVRHELRSPISAIDRGSSEVFGDDPQGFKSYPMERHPVLLKLYRSIGKSFTPFDLATCETQQWSTKHAPSSAEEVLQSGKEAMVLRQWLQNVALSSTDTTKSNSKRRRGRSAAEQRSGAVHDHKRRRVSPRKRHADELCDFIVSSEDESDGMEELSGPEEVCGYALVPRSVVRGGAAAFSETGRTITSATNAMLISGPPGCGKTAAAYAVAKELDFEVFEINPGSRRNGKDLLERVGDVTINHLVHRSKDSLVGNNSPEASSLRQTIGSATDFDNRKASSTGSFFKTQRTSKREVEEPSSSETRTETSTPHQTARVQKQSLILLEEVDVLFEEDKTFWAAVLGLLSQSRRPIIMTCNDENLIPADALPLHGILRFRPPSMDLAVDYLLLLAGAEGHLLRRSAVEALYRSKRHDLRASIMEIDFWCQMAVGDQKAGLEWMHPRCPSWEDGFAGLDALHVASKDTYLTGMGWTSRDAILEEARQPCAVEQELLHEAWNNWDMDVEDWRSGSDIKDWADSFASNAENHSSKMFTACCAFDQFYDGLSSADVFSGYALAVGVKVRSAPFNNVVALLRNQIPLDTTQPALPDHVRFDTVQGYTLLEADPAVEYDGLSTDMALYAKVIAKRLLRAVKDECSGDIQSHQDSFNQGKLIELVTNRVRHEASRDQVTRQHLSAAFDPISEAPSTAPAAPGALQSSDFDRTSSLIVEDLAPYVRAIVLHDVQLEDQRRQIQEQSNKRLRMTRASRSALEGGSRSSMRRDKWFEGELDPNVVLKTGSQEWYEAAAK